MRRWGLRKACNGGYRLFRRRDAFFLAGFFAAFLLFGRAAFFLFFAITTTRRDIMREHYFRNEKELD